MYSTIQVATLFNAARETVRKWAVEFEHELSPSANPGEGRQRVFTDDDLEKIALIVEMKSQGKLYADIHAALANGQRGNPPPGAVAIVPTTTPRTSVLQVRITNLERDLARTVDLAKEQTGVINELRRQLEETKAELRAAYKTIGRLEGE